MPIVSVIIPVYNTESYLKECLDSVLNQTFRDFEIICINDASTDRSKEMLILYQNEHNNVKVVEHTSNKGLSAARNTGLMHASGKYVLFVDSDDMITPDTLKELYLFAEERKTDIIYTPANHLYEEAVDKAQKVEGVEYAAYESTYTGQDLFCRLVKDQKYISSSCGHLYRKDFLDQNDIRFKEGLLHEDILFSFLCSMNAQCVSTVNKRYYAYRHRRESITTTYNNRRAQSLFIILRHIFEYWNGHVFSKEINESIGIFFTNLYYRYKTWRGYDADLHLDRGTYAEQVLYHLLSAKAVSRYATLSTEVIDDLATKKNIILYGAGGAARDIINILQQNNIGILAIAVTDKSLNPPTFYGIEVKNISELKDYYDTATVIVAVTYKYRDDVKNILNVYGFAHVIDADMLQ